MNNNKKLREKSNYVSNACTLCKRRHFKCTGEHTCQNCLIRGVECVYPKPQEKRGPKPRKSDETNRQSEAKKKIRSEPLTMDSSEEFVVPKLPLLAGKWINRQNSSQPLLTENSGTNSITQEIYNVLNPAQSKSLLANPAFPSNWATRQTFENYPRFSNLESTDYTPLPQIPSTAFSSTPSQLTNLYSSNNDNNNNIKNELNYYRHNNIKQNIPPSYQEQSYRKTAPNSSSNLAEIVSYEELEEFMQSWIQNPHYFHSQVYPPEEWKIKLKTLSLNPTPTTPFQLLEKKPFNVYDLNIQQKQYQKDLELANHLGIDGQLFGFLALGARNLGKRNQAELMIQCCINTAKQFFEIRTYETTKCLYLISYYLMYEATNYKNLPWLTLTINSAKTLLYQMADPQSQISLNHIKHTCEIRKITLTNSAPQRLKILSRIRESNPLIEDLIYGRYLFVSSIILDELKTGESTGFSLIDIQEEQQTSLDSIHYSTERENQIRKGMWEIYIYGIGSYVFYRSRLTIIALDMAHKTLESSRIISSFRKLDPGEYFSVMFAARTLYDVHKKNITNECMELLKILNPCFLSYPFFWMLIGILNFDQILPLNNNLNQHNLNIHTNLNQIQQESIPSEPNKHEID